MTLTGIDVSNWNGYVNWGQVALQGFSFGIAKATEVSAAGLYRDPTFPHNWKSIAYRKMVRGAYHFFHPNVDPEWQVDQLHAYIQSVGGFSHPSDFIALDLEVMDGTAPELVTARAAEFVLYAMRSMHRQVVVYVGKYFYDALPRSEVLEAQPLWLPQYVVGPPSPPVGWKVISFWQHSASGHVPGVGGQADMNIFYGNRKQLEDVVAYRG